MTFKKKIKKIRKNRKVAKFVGLLCKLWIDWWFFLTKVEQNGYENIEDIIISGKFIFATWHSRLLLPGYMHKNMGCTVLISNSADGEMVAQMVQYQGNKTVRGSTSRGGRAALSEMVRKLNNEKSPGAIIPDGPKGPANKVQPGIIFLAKKTGFPIIPLSYSAKHFKVFGSWDRFILPWPATRCKLIYGNPIYIPKNAANTQLRENMQHLENVLNELTRQADLFFGHLTEKVSLK